jgi:hypothetical protein
MAGDGKKRQRLLTSDPAMMLMQVIRDSEGEEKAAAVQVASDSAPSTRPRPQIN